ncbi:MAG: HEPN domain-containing protein [Candidatus Muiribacteriota bacterium]
MKNISANINYWIDLSEYDMETAESMLKSKRFLYVGFCCHLSIEKILKAYYVKVNQNTPPKTHNLRFLLKKVDLSDILNEKMKSIVFELEPLNIETRYPEQKEKLLNYLTNSKCLDILNKTREFHLWIKKQLLK